MSRNKKVYISGKITGRKYENAFKHFKKWEDIINGSKGYKAINPMAINPIQGLKWCDYMKEDIAELLDCKCIFMLKGWESSKGAQIEHHIARVLGYDIRYENKETMQFKIPNLV